MSLPHTFLVIFIAFVWGINFVSIQFALRELPPIFTCAIRFILMTFPAIFFVKRPSAPLRWVLLYGFVMFALQFALMFLGIAAGVTAGLASVLLQTQVFFMILFALLFFKEKLTKWQMIGGACAAMGIGIVGANLGGEVTLSGLLFILSAAVCWGLGSVLVKKMGAEHTKGLVIWASLIAWPLLLMGSVVLEGTEAIGQGLARLSWKGALAVAYVTYGSTAFGFTAWNWLVGKYPLSSIAPFTLLIPVFAFLGSTIALGEKLFAWKIAAASCVILGLVLHLIGQRRAQKALIASKDLI
jgi:O-acetylserine/cysteine efflux transporter